MIGRMFHVDPQLSYWTVLACYSAPLEHRNVVAQEIGVRQKEKAAAREAATSRCLERRRRVGRRWERLVKDRRAMVSAVYQQLLCLQWCR
ncbi:hypothetical protein M011DRAFT_16637 [Sporormia fimetaria CBS 119925]|uniref:Uncharacterized protein n=1 Tax=Sporormia fimetaria CBS 119925 TaxID=1340428 RepID=A0A6A6VS91_9PLEO|nr:hypothetical protein M011DRAFT_16637 [Sporormia fimetaria CBS 119925]